MKNLTESNTDEFSSSSSSSTSITLTSSTTTTTTTLSSSTISTSSSSRPNSLLPNNKLTSSIISPEINTPVLSSSSTTTNFNKKDQLNLNEEDYINFNINLTSKFQEQLVVVDQSTSTSSKSNRNSTKSESSVVTTVTSTSINNGGLNNSSASNRNSTNSSISDSDLLMVTTAAGASGNNTPKSNRSSIDRLSTFDRNDSSGSLNSKDSSSAISVSSSNQQDQNSIMLRVKFPESHQIITKILRLPLNSNSKECLLKIHQSVGLENYKDCVIVYNQTTLSPNTTLSSIFGGGDDSIVPTIEIKESKNNKPSPRPILSHSNSVQSLLQGVSIKKRTQSNGQSAKDSILFQPPLPSYTKDLEGLFFITSPNHPNKSIPCLYHKWRSREGRFDSKITIIYSSGNLEDIGLTRKNMRILSNILQCNILCYDMTGFGLNAGKASLKESYEDLNIVFYHLVNNLKINSKNIILMGKSIGTISTLKFASTLFPKLLKSKNSSGTVVIKSPTSPVESCKQYKSVGGIILLNSFGPGGLSDNIVNLLLSLDAFEHLKKVERITCPVLLVHAEDDQIVNVKSSKKLSKLFNNLFKFNRVKDAGHWNLDTQFLDDYEDDLIEFVKVVSPESFANKKERDEPASFAMSPNKVIGNWLDRIELAQYTQNFLQFGYFDMSSISTLDEVLLEMIGIIDQQHIEAIMKEIDKVNKSLYGTTSCTSTYSMMTISSSCSIDSSLNSNGSGILSSNSSCSSTTSSTSSNISNGTNSNNSNSISSVNNSNLKNHNSTTPSSSTPSRNSANLEYNDQCAVNSSCSGCNYCPSHECICNDLIIDKLK